MTIFFEAAQHVYSVMFMLTVPVIYNIKYSDRNLHQKIEFLNENVNVTEQKGWQHLLKYVCIIANNMLTAAV